MFCWHIISVIFLNEPRPLLIYFTAPHNFNRILTIMKHPNRQGDLRLAYDATRLTIKVAYKLSPGHIRRLLGRLAKTGL